MKTQLLTLGNFALSDLSEDEKLVLENVPGGMNFRVVLANAFWGNPADFVTALKPSPIWDRVIKKLGKHQIRPKKIIPLANSIKFVWNFHNQDLNDIEFLGFKQMNLFADISAKIYENYPFVNLCSFGLENEIKILNKLNLKKQRISYIFHESNLKFGTAQGYLKLFENLNFLFMNHIEASILSDKSDIIEAGCFLSQFAEYCFITEQEKGAHVFKDQQHLFTTPAPKLAVINTAGAGDIYAGAVIAGILKGENFEIASRLGTTLASLTTTDYLTENLMKLLI